MSLSPKIRRLLERLGFNATRLQWLLYRWQQRLGHPSRVFRLPASMQWLHYGHKTCLHCGAIVERTERSCPSCHKSVPTLLGYRLFRLLGLMVPAGAPAATMFFMTLIVALFSLSFFHQGPSALLHPTRATLLTFGAQQVAQDPTPEDLWRWLACGLAHIGLLHIGFNLLALTQIGPIIEEQTGPVRMLAIITITQLGSALGAWLWYSNLSYHPNTLSAGASGWLFGLIGFGIAYYRGQGPLGRQYAKFLVRWALYGFVFGLLIGANNAAHFSGLMTGVGLGLLPMEDQRRLGWTRLWSVTAAVCLLLWLISLTFLAHSIASGWSPGKTPLG